MNRQPDRRNLCLQCSKIDFQALFQHPVKIFRLGTLSSIAQNGSCQFCLLVLSIVDKLWSRWRDEIWKPTISQKIGLSIKTTLWAHCSDGPDSATDVPNPLGDVTRLDQKRLKYLRYRVALGSDWTPYPEIQTMSPPFTVCELDLFRGTEIFEMFPLKNDTDKGQILQRRLIPEIVDVSLLQSGIQQCKTQHGHYSGDNRQAALRKTSRFRVIDVKHRTLVQPQEHIDYIALSYVWGDILRGRTALEHSQWFDSLVESCSDDSIISRIRFDRLPATIKDAITLVESIGCRYLWADLICIKQNEEADKHILIENMHLIYEGASFTIVAAGGSDANARLPGWHYAQRPPEDVYKIETNNGPLLMTLSRPPLANLISGSAWSTRSWTFQEDLLSPCCLYFTPSEVFYSCQHHVPRSQLPTIGYYSGFHNGRYSEWRESYVLETKSIKTAYCAESNWSNGWQRYPNSCLRSEAKVITNSDDSCQSSNFYNAIPSHVEFAEYMVFVTEYTKRQLSKADDIVAAFMGILGKFRNEPCLDPDIKSHGLLETHLELSLLWIAVKDIYLQRREISDAHRPQFPSWSWTGWVGAVQYPLQHFEGGRSRECWGFQPITFSPKQGCLKITALFDFLSLSPGKITGWFQEEDYQKRRTEALARALSMSGPSFALILFTYVAEVSLIRRINSFVMRESVFQGEMSHAEVFVGHQATGIIFDSQSAFSKALFTPPDQYRLVVIGRGKRELQFTDTPDLDEWVVLLVKRQGDGEGYERVGLTTILQSNFDGKLGWVHLV